MKSCCQLSLPEMNIGKIKLFPRCIYIDGLQLQIDKIVFQQEIWWSLKFCVYLWDFVSHTTSKYGNKKILN